MNASEQPTPNFAFGRSNYVWLGGHCDLDIGLRTHERRRIRRPQCLRRKHLQLPPDHAGPTVVLAGYGLIFYAILKKR